jgi:hypothetical protein
VINCLREAANVALYFVLLFYPLNLGKHGIDSSEMLTLVILYTYVRFVYFYKKKCNPVFERVDAKQGCQMIYVFSCQKHQFWLILEGLEF